MSRIDTRDSIISEWLTSLGLQQYSEAFYDNGYDELELCKQIEDADLDAIGVSHPLHRKIIFNSVNKLRAEGATSVYFTLEDVNKYRTGSIHSVASQGKTYPSRECLYDVSPKGQPSCSLQPGTFGTGVRNEAQQNMQSYTTDTLTDILQRKLQMDGIDITRSPYIQSGQICVPVVTALAMRYAESLSQNYFRVKTAMEHLVITSLASTTPNNHSSRNVLQGTQSRDKCEMLLGHLNPPAVPSCPPPSQLSSRQISKGNMNVDASMRGSNSQYHRSHSQCSGADMHARHFEQTGKMPMGAASVEAGAGRCHLEHTCGRAKSFQDPSQAFHNCQVPGYDTYRAPQMVVARECQEAACKEAAVFEQKRLETLMQVKTGKLSVEDAMNRIRSYEKQKEAICLKKSKKKSATSKIGEFFKFPSFRKKPKAEKVSTSGKSSRSASCSGMVYDQGALGSSFSTTHLATEFKDKCTCRIQPALPQSRSMTLTPMNCTCEECQRIRGGAFSIPPPPSPMLGHRSTGGGVRGSARYPSNSNRRVPVGADIVRGPATCRQCNTPLNQPQKVLPKFYSPQVTRKTYQPLTSPTPHHYIKPFSEKFDAWYQHNLPSDDETRHLIDQSDDSSMNLSFDVFGPIPKNSHHSIASPPPPLQPTVIQSAPKPSTTPVSAQNTSNATSDLGNSYHSDSLSSDDTKKAAKPHQLLKHQGEPSASPTTVRGRRDSGCYLSNENINNNSSNSSTCEKKSESSDNSAASVKAKVTSPEQIIGGATPSTAAGFLPVNSEQTRVLEIVKRQMFSEKIDLTIQPYTGQEGQWCVPISLVSRYAQLCGTDLTTAALAMDAFRCSELQRQCKKWVALSADTKKTPEQKTVTNVKDFLVLSGLPMYTELFLANGFDTLPKLASINEEKLRKCGITDSLHLEIILSAVDSTWNTGDKVDHV